MEEHNITEILAEICRKLEERCGHYDGCGKVFQAHGGIEAEVSDCPYCSDMMQESTCTPFREPDWLSLIAVLKVMISGIKITRTCLD